MTGGQTRPIWDGPRRDRGAGDRPRADACPGVSRWTRRRGARSADPAPLVGGPDADAACWTLRVDRTGRGHVAGHARGAGPWSCMTVEGGGSGATARRSRLRTLTTIGSALAARPAGPGHDPPRGARRRRPDRDLGRLAAGCGPASRCRRSSTSTAARSAPGRRRRRSRSFLLVARGYRVVLPEHPRLGDATGARGSGRSSATGAASTPPTSTRRSTTSSRSASRTPSGSACSACRTAGSWSTGWSGPRTASAAAVSENGVVNQVQRLGQLATPGPSTAGPRCSATRSRRRASRSSGASRRCATSRRSGRRCSCSRREADLRCPPADNEQLFVALRLLGREVEYVLYPDEYHVYATTGRPDRRIDRMTRMLDWFDRHLKG